MVRFVLFLFLGCGFIQAQQLNCTVTLNTQKINNANQQVFKTLETAINEFVNKTDWTGQMLSQKERSKLFYVYYDYPVIIQINLLPIFKCSLQEIFIILPILLQF